MDLKNYSGGSIMLMALVVSQMDDVPKKEYRFIDYMPEPRKKRAYKKKSQEPPVSAK